jgi:hypothetical protein
MAKTTVQLNDELDSLLTDLSGDLAVPKAQVVRRSIALLKYLQDETTKNGGKVLIQDANGEQKEIVLK